MNFESWWTLALLNDELEIINIEKLLSVNLAIPDYQRPYRWSAKSTNTLFMDTYESYKLGLEEYRLGSVILHKERDKYNIVDGQQRTTTLSILLFALEEKTQSLLNETYAESSVNSIIGNLEILAKRVKELSNEEQKKYKAYLENNCTVVKIVTDSEQEAFQFFDSQNSRGKALKPHDLLKSYHLREMNRDSESLKVKIISDWENTNQNDLEDLFKNYLFPVTQWYKRRDGLNYSTNKIQNFKGIKQSNIFDYAIYHKASNIFIEQVNTSGTNELLSADNLNQFQLTQPIIAGRRFFYWTLHYDRLLEKVKRKIQSFHDSFQIPTKRSGDIYIKQLYESVLLFFADRFGFDSIDEATMQQLYTWGYSLRLKMQAVYPETVNKYSKGGHERINYGLDLFNLISEMTEPQELKAIILEKIESTEVDRRSKYYPIYEVLKDWNGW